MAETSPSFPHKDRGTEGEEPEAHRSIPSINYTYGCRRTMKDCSQQRGSCWMALLVEAKCLAHEKRWA
jgi:hypothetical protein